MKTRQERSKTRGGVLQASNYALSHESYLRALRLFDRRRKIIDESIRFESANLDDYHNLIAVMMRRDDLLGKLEADMLGRDINIEDILAKINLFLDAIEKEETSLIETRIKPELAKQKQILTECKANAEAISAGSQFGIEPPNEEQDNSYKEAIRGGIKEVSRLLNSDSFREMESDCIRSMHNEYMKSIAQELISKNRASHIKVNHMLEIHYIANQCIFQQDREKRASRVNEIVRYAESLTEENSPEYNEPASQLMEAVKEELGLDIEIENRGPNIENQGNETEPETIVPGIETIPSLPTLQRKFLKTGNNAYGSNDFAFSIDEKSDLTREYQTGESSTDNSADNPEILDRDREGVYHRDILRAMEKAAIQTKEKLKMPSNIDISIQDMLNFAMIAQKYGGLGNVLPTGKISDFKKRQSTISMDSLTKNQAIEDLETALEQSCLDCDIDFYKRIAVNFSAYCQTAFKEAGLMTGRGKSKMDSDGKPVGLRLKRIAERDIMALAQKKSCTDRIIEGRKVVNALSSASSESSISVTPASNQTGLGGQDSAFRNYHNFYGKTAFTTTTLDDSSLFNNKSTTNDYVDTFNNASSEEGKNISNYTDPSFNLRNIKNWNLEGKTVTQPANTDFDEYDNRSEESEVDQAFDKRIDSTQTETLPYTTFPNRQLSETKEESVIATTTTTMFPAIVGSNQNSSWNNLGETDTDEGLEHTTTTQPSDKTTQAPKAAPLRTKIQEVLRERENDTPKSAPRSRSDSIYKDTIKANLGSVGVDVDL